MQNQAATGKQCADLLSLNPADLFLIGRDTKNRDLVVSSQLLQIIAPAFEQGPSNAGRDGATCYLYESGPHRNAYDAVGLGIFGGGLDHIQQLLALRNGIIAREQDFQGNIETLGRILGSSRKELLIGIFLQDERKKKFEFFHDHVLQTKLPS